MMNKYNMEKLPLRGVQKLDVIKNGPVAGTDKDEWFSLYIGKNEIVVLIEGNNGYQNFAYHNPEFTEIMMTAINGKRKIYGGAMNRCETEKIIKTLKDRVYKGKISVDSLYANLSSFQKIMFHRVFDPMKFDLAQLMGKERKIATELAMWYALAKARTETWISKGEEI